MEGYWGKWDTFWMQVGESGTSNKKCYKNTLKVDLKGN